MIEEYNYKIKILFLSLFKKIIQINIYKKLRDIICQLQKNIKENIKKNLKNQYL